MGAPAVLGGLASAYFGYRGARSQAQQQAAQNALLREQFEQQKLERAPIIAGAKHQLEGGRWVSPEGHPVAAGTPGAVWQSQFQPFVDAAGQSAVASGNIAQQYQANVPHYQRAGLIGLGGLLSSYQFSPEQQRALGRGYEDPYAAAQYRFAAQDIQDAADRQRREQAIADAGRLTPLSGQAARATGQIEAQRARQLAQLGADIGSRSYQYGQQQGQNYLANQQALAQNLLSAGTSGLSQAQQAAQLGSGAYQQGIQAPFLPFQTYAQTLGQAPQVQAPQFGTVTDPFATGAGLGIQAYNLLRDK